MRVYRCDRCFDLHDGTSYTATINDQDGVPFCGLLEICFSCSTEIKQFIYSPVTSRTYATPHGD